MKFEERLINICRKKTSGDGLVSVFDDDLISLAMDADKLKEENKHLKQMLRKLATAADECVECLSGLNDDCNAMHLADIIIEAERMSQIEAG